MAPLYTLARGPAFGAHFSLTPLGILLLWTLLQQYGSRQGALLDVLKRWGTLRVPLVA